MKFCINGIFVDEKKAAISVLDSGFLYADGFYDTMRVYDGALFELPLHLKRIETSAKAMNIAVPKSETLAEWLQAIVRINKLREARVRITMTRGTGRKPTVVITCENLVRQKGSVRCETAMTMRLTRIRPVIKTLGGLAVLGAANAEKRRRGADQVIMIDERGFVREALTSNLFIVRNGRLLTPKTKVLPGLTRTLVMNLAKKSGMKVSMRDFKKSLLQSSDEIFLTNRIRDIIPIIALNGKKVGSGKMGSVTKGLKAAYASCVNKTCRS